MKKIKKWNLKKEIYSYFKRILDILISFFIIVVISPIMIIISIIIKLDSNGPIIFKQIRTGKNGKEFKILKFRTMVENNNVMDFSVDDKYTKIGLFLRKTSLDEIPQLFNIILGEMSFFGPRPWIPEYYKNMNNKQKHRVDVVPGLSGLAQVMGRNGISIFEKINYDLEYIDNYSLLEDLKIAFLTIKVVFNKKGNNTNKSIIKEELKELKKKNNKK